MELLEKNELLSITGGGLSLGVISLIGAGITFLIGVLDGYLRPLKCNK